MRVDRGQLVAGMDALDIRSFFKRSAGCGLGCKTVMKTFSISKKKAEKLIQDLVELKMIRRAEFQPEKNVIYYETTIAGNAFGMAKGGKPVSRVSAERILGEFLERVRCANRRSEFAYTVESVVVFGSYLTDRNYLNDLDLAVELKPRETDNDTFKQLCQARIDAAGERRFADYLEQLSWPEREIRLFLKKRSRTISLCQWESLFDMPDLQYCVLVGDKRRIRDLIKYGKPVDPVSESRNQPRS
jgi:predicted nucleotidyltransferase